MQFCKAFLKASGKRPSFAYRAVLSAAMTMHPAVTAWLVSARERIEPPLRRRIRRGPRLTTPLKTIHTERRYSVKSINTMPFKLRQLSAALAMAVVALPAYAQETRTLDSVVVVGTRTPAQISQIPAAVWVVEQEELRAQIAAGGDLKTALGRLVPGLDLAPEGRTNFGQNLRGREAQVLIDGVSLSGSRSLSRQFDAIDPFNIERIEVLSGASSLYGGGATGGIINIVTRKGESVGLHGRTEARVTSGFNRRDDLDTRLAQSVSGGSERLQGYLGVALQDNGRWFDAGGDEIFPDLAQTDLQDNRSVDLLGNVTFKLAAAQTLNVTAQLYRSGYQGDRGVYFPNLAAASPNLNDAEIRDGYRADREPATDRQLVNAQYHHANLLRQNFYLQAFYRKEESSFQGFPWALRPRGYEFRASQQNTDVSGIKALFDARLSDAVGLTYGVDADYERFDASQMYFDKAMTDATGGLVQNSYKTEPRYPGFKVNAIAAYAQGNWRATPGLKLSGGVRAQRTRVEIEDFKDIPGGKNDYAFTLYNASALYDFRNGHQNWLRYSQGTELPDPAKYYGRRGVTVADNPLAAIATDQVELGWRYGGRRWTTQAALYYAWSDKALEFNRADLSIDVIDQKKRDYGLELAATRRFDHGFEAGGTLHQVRSEQKNTLGGWDKRDARYASLSSATAFVGWADAAHTARLQANHAFDLKDDSGRRIDGYTTFDLIASRRTRLGRFALGVQNLLNEQYSTVWGQRAAMFYSPNFGPAYLYDFQGRGRTYSLAWSLDY